MSVASRAMLHRSFATPVVVVIVLALLAGACGGGSSTSLPGTSWVVTSIGGAVTEALGAPTMEFGPSGAVVGTTGCNRYSGEVTIDGDRIAFGNIGSTLIGCDGAIATQEHAFLTALDGATTWGVGQNGDLTIKGTSEIVATPMPSPTT